MNMRQHRKARHLGMQRYIGRAKAGSGRTPWQRYCMVVHSGMSLKQVRRNYYQPAYASVRAAVTLVTLTNMHRQCIARGTMAFIYAHGDPGINLRSRPVRAVLVDELDDLYDAAMSQAYDERNAK